MKAPREDQLQLLKVAQLDGSINRLERENQKHPLRESVGKLMNGAAGLGKDLQNAQERLEEAKQSLRQAEEQSANLQGQIAQREEKYNAGEGLGSYDLLVLEGEMKTLREKLEVASDSEFAALEEVEAAEGQITDVTAKLENLKVKLAQERRELEEAVEKIVSEQAELRIQRDGLYFPLATALKNVYEHAVLSGGYAVMAMTPDGVTDGGIRLSPVEVARIKNNPEDEIYLSEDYDCIIVPVESR